MCDLCVSLPQTKNIAMQLCREAEKTSICTLAFEHFVNGGKIEEKDSVPKVFGHLDFHALEKETKVKLLKRLTFKMTDIAQGFTLHPSNHNLKGYDFLAAVADNEKIFHKICSSVDVDLITFEFSQRLSFRPKISSINAAVERGLHFEIKICDPEIASNHNVGKRNLISNILEIIHATRGRNLIFSSGASNSLSLRNSDDFEAIGKVVGLSARKLRMILFDNPEKVIMRGYSRSQTYLSAILVPEISSLCSVVKKKREPEKESSAKRSKQV